MPLYSCMQETPEPLKYAAVDNFTFKSAAWVFNLVANVAYRKYSYIIKDIQKVQKKFEDKFFTVQPAVEQAAMQLYKQDKEMAVEYLSDYSVNQVNDVVDRWRELWRYLVMKYNDGYINDVTKDGGRRPKGVGYGDEYYRRVLEDRPGYYDVIWRKKDD
jgi:dipeptidase